MDKYQAAIVEYEAARKHIIQLGHDIRDSIGSFIGDRYQKTCTCGITSDHPLDDTDCVPLLYKWNKLNRDYLRDGRTIEYDGLYPDEFGDKPELCEAGKITDKLIQDRKAARQRFGIAKRRLSALAKPFANPKTPDV